ncbi:mechanosensitive ion channel [Candidatus Accumulibacter phosphatis]|uniref:Small-conductance mechanosensitive channel n=1 Tax=Candidatus Accumulibacter phosphatis TaxID=327160 RepID=A0ABX1U0W5_9PROT|nr:MULTISPECIES: mechanosensitive ion channel domain-containing protein [Candidatus Accumulibacter]NMQ29330.1 mechanosensitive ion channel [Candidatus Accumulibacter phosphatis]
MEVPPLQQLFKDLGTGTLLELLLIVVLTTTLIVSVQRLLPWLAEQMHGKHRLYLLAIVPLLRLGILVVAFLWIVPLIVKPSLQNMVALFGTIGLALGFAMKDYASSLIAGIVAVGEMPYRNGDWIEVNGIYGEVTHIGMRTVQIVTADDTLVSIPHLRLWSDPIFNANCGRPQLQCAADFYLHPAHDAAAAKAVLQDVALTSPYPYFDDPIMVVVHEKPWGTHYRLKAYPIDARQQFRFISDLTVRGKAALLRHGVSFATAPALADKQA